MNKIKTKLSSILLLVLLQIFMSLSGVIAAEVSTYISGSGLNGPDGIVFDASGNLYVANWGNGSGSTVIKIFEGEASEYLSELNAPDGLAFDKQGNFYISNFNSGVINKVTKNGIKTVFVKGLDHPSDLVFDANGNLYVSIHGNGKGTKVLKILADGTTEDYASGFDAPLGIVFDSAGNLYVSNYNSGVINKVTADKKVSVFAKVSNSPKAKLQYLALDAKGNLYAPSYGHNKIYMVSSDGKISDFAGTGDRGSKNGAATSAQFDGPNSIAIDSSGVIFVSEYNANRIRTIIQGN